MDRAGSQLLPILGGGSTPSSPPARQVPARCEDQARAAKYRDYLVLARNALELVTNSALARTVQSRCFSLQRVRRTTRRLQVREDAHARSDPALVARREFVRNEAGRRRDTDARSKAVPEPERIAVSALR